MNGIYCRDIEQIILKYLKSNYDQPVKYFHGYSECFYDVDIDSLRQLIIDEINLRVNIDNNKTEVINE